MGHRNTLTQVDYSASSALVAGFPEQLKNKPLFIHGNAVLNASVFVLA